MGKPPELMELLSKVKTFVTLAATRESETAGGSQKTSRGTRHKNCIVDS